jgi:hypothetical protein
MSAISAAEESESPCEILLDARTVALIVHGVGDHSQANILDELQMGLESTLPPGAYETKRQWIRMPQPSGNRGDVEVTWLRTTGGDRVIIPVIWSSQHLRAETTLKSLPVPHSQRLPLAIVLAARPLLQLYSNTCRCIPKGAGVAWKLILAVAAFLVLVLVASVTLGLFWCLTFLPGILLPNKQNLISTLVGVVLTILPLLLYAIFRKSVPVLDLVGDVVFYVGQAERRREVEDTMLSIITWVRENSPHAEIIVVGHSLGSVLVSHCLKDTTAIDRSRSLLLVTLGSPLPMMSHVFPKHILTPSCLLERYSKNRSVSFWMHFWRDSDWIGRSLHIGPSVNFAEVSVGDGPHENYWADPRVWTKLIALIELHDSGTVTASAHEWATRELTDDEKLELRSYFQAVRTMPFVMLAVVVGMGYVGVDVFSSAFATKTSPLLALVIKVLYAAGFVPLFLLGFALFATDQGGTERQRLARLRFALSLFVPLSQPITVVTVALMALHFLAQGH